MLVDNGEIVEARIAVDGVTLAGTVLDARLIDASRPAVARAGGVEYLLPAGAQKICEGAAITIEVTREAIPGGEPWKRPLARIAEGPPRAAPPVDGRTLAFPAPADALALVGWPALLEEARGGIAGFDGGMLRISPTPAMTLIDVDGFLAADELAVRGAAAAAKAIRRLDIGGSIGIDLPTVGGKAARTAAAEAIDAALPQPFERTAVNGFGFVQVVRPRRRASLVELAQERAAFEARALLRHAAFEPAGAKRLVAHPAVIAVLHTRSAWRDALSLQLGGAVGLRADPALPMSGGYAENA